MKIEAPKKVEDQKKPVTQKPKEEQKQSAQVSVIGD
jgi:hypothetical protein